MARVKRLTADEELKRLKNWSAFGREFLGGTDLAAAVVGAAWLDARLRRLLESFLIDDPDAVAPLLDGALGTFATRARMAMTLGLISRASFEDLSIIKDVRNAFAHEPPGLTFADPRITSACRQLRIPKGRPAFAAVPRSDARKLFEMSVAALANRISRGTAKALRVRRKLPPR